MRYQLLVYADDVNMLGENPQKIRGNAEILVEANKATGLEVNPEKTKYMIMSRDENIVRNGTIKIGDLSFEEVEKFKYLGATVTNINDTREEIKRRINMGNACYYSVEKLLSSSLLSKNLKVRIYKTVILPEVIITVGGEPVHFAIFLNLNFVAIALYTSTERTNVRAGGLITGRRGGSDDSIARRHSGPGRSRGSGTCVPSGNNIVQCSASEFVAMKVSVRSNSSGGSMSNKMVRNWMKVFKGIQFPRKLCPEELIQVGSSYQNSRFQLSTARSIDLTRTSSSYRRHRRYTVHNTYQQRIVSVELYRSDARISFERPNIAYSREKNRRVQGLVIVLARERRHVKKLSVRETSEQRQRNYHLPDTLPQRKHVLHPSTA
ncbi:hypothetical protein ANN_20846 [Periplaneta americana]|uniref:Reverse transcriptase domain-containing protein n=1 Tax=Periplaneta americana TaxID=6978 RepID=A0ABQ8SEI1_PERAM|nr:hypothetical protein ANN_20846 [Periplaneta americana]